MMPCPICQQPNPAGATVCQSCGSPLGASTSVATPSLALPTVPEVSVLSMAEGVWIEGATLSYGSSVLSVSFSSDGKFLASGYRNNIVRVWEVGSWQKVATLRGHRSGVYSVSFSPDGKFLASGSWDETVKVWEVGSWREVITLRGHGDWVRSVSFSPDGKFLASGSRDETVKVWEVGG